MTDDRRPNSIDLQCCICGKRGALSAGDTWCDHCEECHEHSFVWDPEYGYCYPGPVPDSRDLFMDLARRHRSL
jgi:hypothetical protein